MTNTARKTLETLRWIVWIWQHRARTRAALQALDKRLLDDVGLTQGDQKAECAKEFWR